MSKNKPGELTPYKSPPVPPSCFEGGWVLHFDGACEPINPGGTASYGWVLLDPDGNRVGSGSGVVDSGPGMTNNVAEWAALETGLKYLSARGMRVAVLFKGDSKLVVNQVTGAWRCHKEHLAAARERVWALLSEVATAWGAVWVPREQNEEADLLSKTASSEDQEG